MQRTGIAGQAVGTAVAQRGVFVGAGDKPHAVLDVLDDLRVLFVHRAHAAAVAGRGGSWGGRWEGGCSSDNYYSKLLVRPEQLLLCICTTF